ncbi:MarR family transcriptional regulator [Cupriavidus oxalaticus]|uniref:MarR family winged helix-turn-helix transcriptional regulator n=1 Tax=Cupriavidus oxalaticus TaxID=96344 RepID=UPI00317477C5
MEARVMEGAQRNGYGEVTPAMNKMFAHMVGPPVSLSELARHLAVSRQAVHQLANEAARLGLVEFVPSELDGRVRLLRFTEKGWTMSAVAAKDFESVEDELAKRIGNDDLATLRRILGKAWSEDEQA